MEIIGRQREREVLQRCENSGKPEFLAVYGRRRVGKTFIITQHFKNKFTFSVTGISGGSMKEQLQSFHSSLQKHFKIDNTSIPHNWLKAFSLLEDYLERDISSGRKVLFIDEMPWFDTPKSGFLHALEHFWNSYASRNDDILLIVCGSSASWIINKLLDDYGGLYNRVTDKIVLEPFNLYDCEEFYRSRGVVMNRQQIAEAYMVFGGIPYYMDLFDKSYGLSRNIDLLLFDNNAKLENEWSRLYHSLFRVADNHLRIAEVLSKHTQGLSRQEISVASGISDGGGLTKVLDELESCRLIGRSYDYKNRKSGDIFKLIDFFSLFYFAFIKGKKNNDPHLWTNMLESPAHRIWCGYAFERLCMAHIRQIKQKLGISGVITEIYAFRATGQAIGAAGISKEKKRGAQIDIIIDRKDGFINLCECKFSISPYALTEQDIEDLRNKRDVFIRESGTKKAVHLTMITVNGLVHNAYRNDIQAEITLDDLFRLQE